MPKMEIRLNVIAFIIGSTFPLKLQFGTFSVYKLLIAGKVFFCGVSLLEEEELMETYF